MISHLKAKAILAALSPHTLHDDSPHPINPQFWHITEYELNKMGIGSDELEGHNWYDGKETHYKGGVHVILKDKLAEYCKGDREQLPVTLSNIRVGSKLRTVEDVIDTLANFISDDINGKMPMTIEARAVCATVLRMGKEQKRI